MVTDENEPGGVKPPTYTDEDGNPQDMTYQTGGGYTFEMPEHSTELDVEYIRTTSKLSMDPANVTFHVVQTRTGGPEKSDGADGSIGWKQQSACNLYRK